MRREKKVLSREDAFTFLSNMRRFAGFGRITARQLSNGWYAVTASAAAWSNWVPSEAA